MALNDAKAAVVAASDACWRAPDLPQAHYAYGQAFAALGLHEHAEQAFAHAIKLQPLWADAWVNYGVEITKADNLDRDDDEPASQGSGVMFDEGHGDARPVPTRPRRTRFRRRPPRSQPTFQ